MAQVAYEMGWAYVLGTPIVIVARQDQPTPFDVDLQAVLLQDDGADAERVALAIQAGLYGTQRSVTDDCLAATVAEVRTRFGSAMPSQIRTILEGLPNVRDATLVRLTLGAILDRSEGANALLTSPGFPGSYPLAERPVLFHVTGFRAWAKVAQEEVRNASERATVEYRIGSESLSPEIVRSVWDDLCQASFVVADITNLNPNAVLELGIAHSLGRPTLILCRTAFRTHTSPRSSTCQRTVMTLTIGSVWPVCSMPSWRRPTGSRARSGVKAEEGAGRLEGALDSRSSVGDR